MSVRVSKCIIDTDEGTMLSSKLVNVVSGHRVFCILSMMDLKCLFQPVGTGPNYNRNTKTPLIPIPFFTERRQVSTVSTLILVQRTECFVTEKKIL